MKTKPIVIYEHQRLYVGEKGFQQKHLDALLKLNEYNNWQYFKPIANGIQFTQYVGVLQVAGLLIEILPKADKYEQDSKWQNVLLPMLQVCKRLKVKTAGVANVKRTNLNLLEVYFELFLTEVQGLQRKGLIKQYSKQTKNTKALKGKLEFAGHFQKNVVHKERFYTTHQVYDTDHLLHQVLYKALEIVTQFSKGTWLYDTCKRVDLNFPEVSRKQITLQQLNLLKLNRKSKDYAYALELARLIILNYSPNISGGKEKMLSLLFDMNVLWEEYVVTKLREETKNTDIQIKGGDSKLFWSNNSLRPDIVVKKGEETYIIDTKWKCLNNNAASIQDLRQMYAYGRFWGAEKTLLLYPGQNRKNEFKKFETIDCINGQEMKHQCKIGFVSVLEGDSLSKKIGKQILELLEFHPLKNQ
ncbi:5-methylcytosine-specific restriction enzyme subunit McrC [Tenacibaculum sp. 190524A02b]|uniref:5-methylcytosine-specific restriction enzyme subunit McrC n=1 Tax=Tenacibaculum vairaonense TaxID=3137860 RepID=A0ABP1FA24_9FLAO